MYTPGQCGRCDDIIEKNARLTAMLRRMMGALHRALNHSGVNWTKCREEVCAAAYVAMVDGTFSPPAPQRN